MAWLLLYRRRNMWLRAWFRWKAELRLIRRSEGIVRKKRKDELPRDCGRLIFFVGDGKRGGEPDSTGGVLILWCIIAIILVPAASVLGNI